jgi:hypothetical protein
MNLHIGRKADESHARIEAGLAKWLHGLEPAELPIALRLRTFADLREEAARPRRPLSWMLPALSSIAALGAVVLGAGLIMLLVVAGATLDHTAGGPGPVAPSGQPPLGQTITSGPNLPALLVILVASGLAGLSLLAKPTRGFAGRMVFGKGEIAPAAVLPLRRPWRSIRRLTWALGALTVVTIALSAREFIRAFGFVPPEGAYVVASSTPGWLILSFCSQVIAAPLALVVAWRYPRNDRASRWLLVGAIALLVDELLMLSMYEVLWWLGGPWTSFLVTSTVSTVGILALTVGLAGRSGSLPRPPIRLAAAAVGTAFFAATFSMAYSWLNGATVNDQDQLEWVAICLMNWLALVAWLSILWVGIWAVRRSRSGAWALLLGTGLLQLSSSAVAGLLQVWTELNRAADGAGGYWNLAMWWTQVATCLGAAALFGALLVGLRPVPRGGEPRSGDVMDGSPPATPAPAETQAIESPTAESAAYGSSSSSVSSSKASSPVTWAGRTRSRSSIPSSSSSSSRSSSINSSSRSSVPLV